MGKGFLRRVTGALLLAVAALTMAAAVAQAAPPTPEEDPWEVER